MSQDLEIHSKHSCPGEKMEKTPHISGQRIILNSSSVLYFLENREESPLQSLFTNTLSCTTMSVFSPKILYKATAKKKKKVKPC